MPHLSDSMSMTLFENRQDDLSKNKSSRRVSFDNEVEEMFSHQFDKKLIMRKIQVSHEYEDDQNKDSRRSDKIRSYYNTIKLGNFCSSRELKQKGFSSGLIKGIYEHVYKYPVKIHCDERGFSTIDNTVLLSNPTWTEDDELDGSSISSAATLNRFWFSPKKQIGPSSEQDPKPTQELSQISAHLLEILAKLTAIKSSIEQSNSEISITIAVDTPSPLPKQESPEDKNVDTLRFFIDTLKKLECLPVQIIISLKERMDTLTNTINSELKKTRVIHGYLTEVEEVKKHQKWLNYSIPLHKARKIGCSNEFLDALSVRKFTLGEVKSFCEFICDDDSFADPQLEWNDFLKVLKLALSFENDQWNPIKKKYMPWIDIKKLKKDYGKRRKNSI